MPSSSSYLDLSSAEWKALQERADRFESARRQGAIADWEPFLPAAGDRVRPRILSEFIKIDLEYSWKSGWGEPLEYYAARFPELGPFAALPLDLIEEEYRLRHRFGDRPSLNDYRARFPNRDAELARMKPPGPTGDRPDAPGRALSPLATAHEATETQREPRHPERPPTTPGASAEGSRYEFLSRIGAGQFGEVWKARAPGGVEVAVKILHQSVERSEASRREEKSLEMIKNLRHPCLLSPQAIWTEHDRICIAMELADGTLRDRLNECRQQGLPGIPIKELFRYFKDAAEGIDYLHGQKVLHRDIKPDNLLLQKGHAKVADFGLARLQTTVVSIAGTPVYMAPEIWLNKACPGSDLYSLAFSYVELRCGKRPIADADFAAGLTGNVERKLDLSGLDSAERAVVLRALAKGPTDRPASCLDFVTELRRALAGRAAPSGAGNAGATPAGGIPVVPVADPPPPPPPVRPAPRPLETVAESLHTVPKRPARRPIAPATRKKTGRALVWTVGLLVLVNLIGGGLFFGWPVIKGLMSSSEPTDEKQVVVTPTTSTPTTHRQPPNTTSDELARKQEAERKQQEAKRKQEAEQKQEAERKRLAEEQRKAAAKRRLAFPPPGLKPQPGTEMVVYKGQSYPKRIGYETKDGLTAWFVLVPADAVSGEPPFYIMQNKVWLGLYRELLEMSTSGTANRHAWIIRVKVEDAQRCAKKLGGNLPTPRQWDRAAGLTGDVNGTRPPIGPACGHDVGLRRLTDPSDDVSALGVRDLTGSGREWTRQLAGGPPVRLVPIANPASTDQVIVRGRYSLREPITIQQLRAEAQKPQTQPYTQPADDLGFRVVIELPE